MRCNTAAELAEAYYDMTIDSHVKPALEADIAQALTEERERALEEAAKFVRAVCGGRGPNHNELADEILALKERGNEG
jgi:hypothetical protein